MTIFGTTALTTKNMKYEILDNARWKGGKGKDQGGFFAVQRDRLSTPLRALGVTAPPLFLAELRRRAEPGAVNNLCEAVHGPATHPRRSLMESLNNLSPSPAPQEYKYVMALILNQGGRFTNPCMTALRPRSTKTRSHSRFYILRRCTLHRFLLRPESG